MDSRQQELSNLPKEELLVLLEKNEISIAEYLRFAEKAERKAKYNAQRSQDFLMILYPEDSHHMEVLKWLKEHEHIIPHVYILHDKDVYQENGTHKVAQDDGTIIEVEHKKGDHEKDHYHVYFHRRERSTVKSQSKFMTVHVENCSSVDGSLMYFLHQTIESAHKYQYPLEALNGTKKFIDKVSIQKSHFVQLRFFVALAQKGYTLTDMVGRIECSDMDVKQKNEYLEFLLSHGYLLGVMTNQELTRDKERMRYAQFDDYHIRAAQIFNMQEIHDLDSYFETCIDLGVSV